VIRKPVVLFDILHIAIICYLVYSINLYDDDDDNYDDGNIDDENQPSLVLFSFI